MGPELPPPIPSRAVAAIVDLLDQERLMTVACNRPDGWPQATTVGYVNEGLNLYFIVARTSQKFANLQADPRASVAIRFASAGSGGGGVGVSMAGRAVEVEDSAVVERLNRLVAGRFPEVHVYFPSGDAVAVMRFRPGIVSPVGVAGGRSDPRTFTVGEPEKPGAAGPF